MMLNGKSITLLWFQKLERRSAHLCRKYPDNGVQIQEKQKEALDNWERLEDLADARKIKLSESYQLHKFLTDSREQNDWCEKMMQMMTSGELAKDVLEAEEQLEMHQERKAEIDGRHAHYASMKEHGENLLQVSQMTPSLSCLCTHQWWKVIKAKCFANTFIEYVKDIPRRFLKFP